MTPDNTHRWLTTRNSGGGRAQAPELTAWRCSLLLLVQPITFRVGSTLPVLNSSVGHVFVVYLPKTQ